MFFQVLHQIVGRRKCDCTHTHTPQQFYDLGFRDSFVITLIFGLWLWTNEFSLNISSWKCVIVMFKKEKFILKIGMLHLSFFAWSLHIGRIDLGISYGSPSLRSILTSASEDWLWVFPNVLVLRCVLFEPFFFVRHNIPKTNTFDCFTVQILSFG